MRVRRNPVELCVSRQVGLVRSLSGKETRPATKMSSRTSTVETKVSRIRHEDFQSNTEMSGALLLRHSDELADAPNQRWQVAAVQRGPPRRMWSQPFRTCAEDRQLKQNHRRIHHAGLTALLPAAVTVQGSRGPIAVEDRQSKQSQQEVSFATHERRHQEDSRPMIRHIPG